MALSILSVGYPLAPVSADAAGGAEQILAALDRAITEAGHRSTVIACAGSRVCGALVGTPRIEGPLTDSAKIEAETRHRIAIEETLSRVHVDLIHMHGFDWHEYLPAPGVPLLATLHLPIEWYPADALRMERAETHLNCVSNSQRASAGALGLPLHVVENGVAVDRLATRVSKRGYAFALARVCPEKGLHHAVEAAKIAGVPMILCGEVFPYEAHMRYFERELAPRLDGLRRWRGPAGLKRKRRLMAGARCVLVPSTASETSSLVAMEALACGTPVIAFNSGALPEIVEHGRTGYIVNDAREMAEAIGCAHRIDPEECRSAARERFSYDRMAGDYLALYDRILRGRFAAAGIQSDDAIHRL